MDFLAVAITGGIILLLLVLVLSYFIKTGNTMERLKVKIREAESGIDVALTKRFDTLTKLLDSVWGFTKHEQETILQTIQLRQNMSIPQRAQVEQQLAEAQKQINVLAEAYPALTSQAVFVQLQNAAMDTEEHLQAARRLYNANVSTLNQMVVSFPSSVVAATKNMQQLSMFEAEAHKRADVSLQM